jgi:putative chitinase
LQVTSIGVIVDEFERRKLSDVRWLAYILATVWHEARFMSVAEIGRGKGKDYGVPHKLTGKVYYGRGFPQLTWYDNYLKFERTLINMPLTTNPELALIVPVSVAILFEGMTTGVTAKDSFTKYQLHDFFSATVDDPVNARRIINGTDDARLIAGHHYAILDVLEVARVTGQPQLPPPRVTDVVAHAEQTEPARTAEAAMAGAATTILTVLIGLAALIGAGLIAWLAT